MMYLPAGAVVVEMHSYQGQSRPDSTWHELGQSLPIKFFVYQARLVANRPARNTPGRQQLLNYSICIPSKYTELDLLPPVRTRPARNTPSAQYVHALLHQL